MTPEERAELRRLLAGATPGPWANQRGTYSSKVSAERRIVCAADPSDAALIAAAVNALPALLDALDAAECERDEGGAGAGS